MTKVLFLCSANRDRSPTAESVFTDVSGWKVRSAGTESYAETLVTQEMLDWADRIFVMEDRHLEAVLKLCPSCRGKISVLGVQDVYSRNSAQLVATLIAKMAHVVELDEWASMKFDLTPIRDNSQKEKEPKRKYYTKENPGGPWSRALYQKRTGEPFNEEEFKNQTDER